MNLWRKPKQNIKKRIIFFGFGIFLILGLFVYGHTSQALSAEGIGARPGNPDQNVKYSDSWFIYNLAPGESKEDTIEVFNITKEKRFIHLYAADSVATGDGNFTLKKEDEPRTDVGSWVQLSTTTIALSPGESRKIPFTITIPQGIDVGEHSGGILIQDAQPTGDVVTGAGSASIVTRVGIRIYETVPGALRQELSLKNFSVKKISSPDGKSNYQVFLQVENTGNVSLTSHVDIRVTGWGKTEWFQKSEDQKGIVLNPSDWFDFFKGQTETREWQILRGTVVDTTWEWPVPVFGRFTFQAHLTFDDSDGKKVLDTKSISFWVIPWTQLIIFLLLLMGIAGIIFGKRLRSRKGWVEYMVKKNDSLTNIALKTGVSPKRLMRINHLKEPAITAGQSIRVPALFIAVEKTVKKLPDLAVAAPARKPRTRKAATTARPKRRTAKK